MQFGQLVLPPVGFLLPPGLIAPKDQPPGARLHFLRRLVEEVELNHLRLQQLPDLGVC